MKIAVLFACAVVQAAAFVVPQQPRTPSRLYEEATETETEPETETMGASAISSLTKDVKTVFTTEDIDKILPHRYPFALVDKVVEYEAGKVRFLDVAASSLLRPCPSVVSL